MWDLKNKKVTLCLLCTFLATCSLAQHTSAIKGVVIEEDNHPVFKASVTIYHLSDIMSAAMATATNEKGFFQLSSVPADDYLLRITCVRHDSVEKIFPLRYWDNDSVHADTLRMNPVQKMLPEVQITGRKNFITMEADKMVFSVDQMGGVAGGNAGGVLQKVPLVDVDKDGNVSLRGKAASVLIDGKPSPFSDISTALQMISSSGVARVEVMTSPPAKYDAEGQGGIVNIVLKKNQQIGTHGLINLDLGTRTDYHAGTDFNRRKKRWNIFGNINYHT